MILIRAPSQGGEASTKASRMQVIIYEIPGQSNSFGEESGRSRLCGEEMATAILPGGGMAVAYRPVEKRDGAAQDVVPHFAGSQRAKKIGRLAEAPLANR
jgi:hypothetical protein